MIPILKHVTQKVVAEIDEELALRQTQEIFLLFAMGSQFDHLIKMMVDSLGVFCLVADPVSVTAEDIKLLNPRGIIISGGPASVVNDAPPFDNKIFDLGIPVLGICLGFQMWAKHIGVKVSAGERREYGTHELSVKAPNSKLFRGLPSAFNVLESHGDHIELDSYLMRDLACTPNVSVAAGGDRHLWGVQFHPEVTHTEHGREIFANFCFRICGAKDVFPVADAAAQKVQEVRETIGANKVLIAESGGSDSSTVTKIIEHAVEGKPGQVTAVYIKGTDRPDDETHVLKYFGNLPWLELKIIDATDRFLKAVKGRASMEGKRLAMRGVYNRILQEEAEKCGARFVAQGTLYTDRTESGEGYESGARKAVIKPHHNVGLKFTKGIKELLPLSDCVKDTGRAIGRVLGVPEELLVRQPFPGPGLLVRIEGAIDPAKLAIARKADGIYIEELRRAGLYESVWQAAAVLTKSKTTCTKGDDRASGWVLALWAVWSVNGFTAQWAELPNKFLRSVSCRITDEIPEVGRVVYAISDKPPATIEWG